MNKIILSLVTLLVMGTSTGFCTTGTFGHNNSQPRHEQVIRHEEHKKDMKCDKQQPKEQKCDKKDNGKCHKEQVCKESSTRKNCKCSCKNCKKDDCKKNGKKCNCKKHSHNKHHNGSHKHSVKK